MKALLVIGIVVIAAVAYIVYPIQRAIRVSKEIEANTTPYKQHPADARTRILVAGDSTGVGTGARIPQESIAGRVGSYFPNADIQNISENGITTAQLQQKLKALPESTYDLAIIQIGANDVTGFTLKKELASELSSVLEYTTMHASSTIVLTAGDIGRSPTFKFPLSILMAARTRSTRQLFMDEIAQHPSVAYVDLLIPSIDDVFASNIQKYYARDRFHPSSDGYALWYQQLEPVLSKLPLR